MPAQMPGGRFPHPALGPGGPGSTLGPEPIGRLKNSNRPGFKFGSPKSAAKFIITGVTRDSTGVALANCVVECFRTSDDFNVTQTVSDGSGNFTLTVATNGDTYFLVAFNSANTLAGATVEGLIATPVGT